MSQSEPTATTVAGPSKLRASWLIPSHSISVRCAEETLQHYEDLVGFNADHHLPETVPDEEWVELFKDLTVDVVSPDPNPSRPPLQPWARTLGASSSSSNHSRSASDEVPDLHSPSPSSPLSTAPSFSFSSYSSSARRLQRDEDGFYTDASSSPESSVGAGCSPRRSESLPPFLEPLNQTDDSDTEGYPRCPANTYKRTTFIQARPKAVQVVTLGGPAPYSNTAQVVPSSATKTLRQELRQHPAARAQAIWLASVAAAHSASASNSTSNATRSAGRTAGATRKSKRSSLRQSQSAVLSAAPQPAAIAQANWYNAYHHRQW